MLKVRNKFLSCAIFTVFLAVCIGAAFAAAGLGTVVSASEASKLPDETRVIIKGKIVDVGDMNHYTLEDSSGKMLLSIRKDLPGAADVKAGDEVEVAGEMDQESMYGTKLNVYAVLNGGQPPKYTSIAEARSMPDDSRVVMKGQIRTRVDEDEYVFADDADEMVVEIDNSIWGNVTHDKNATVEIWGKTDIKKKTGIVQLDVIFIRQL